MQFDRVTLKFGGKTLFREVSFTIQKGERCGLVGQNGSGKSTLLRLINKELEEDEGAIVIPKHYRIGYLQQHIRFTKPTVIEEAALGLPEQEKDHLYKAEKILFGLGFTEENLDQSPAQFSGGFQLRLHLAKVLISEPDCLLLDEPTNYLDIVSIQWLTQFLSKWAGECILISHDRDFMDKVTTHTMGIHREKVKKIKGTTIDFFEQLLVEEELQEKARVKMEKKREHMQSYVDRFGAKASKAGQAQSRKKMLEREPVLEKLNALSHLSFSFHEAPFPGKKMVDGQELSFAFTEEPLIEKVSIEIAKGDRVGIIGKNGRGKSTLLRLIGGDLAAQSGSLQVSDNVRLGYFGQTNIDRLSPDQTIGSEISLANPNLNLTEVKGIAGVMMFSGDLSDKKIGVLSGGEKSRVLLGKIVAKPCNLLLLDEPTHHLDIESIEALIDAIEDFSGAVVIVTHSELILRRLNLDKIILCEEGKQTLFFGNYDEFLDAIGWNDERSKGKTGRDNPRKERADLVAKRRQALKPIEKEIEEYEKELTALELEQKNQQQLIEKGEISGELIKAVSLRGKQIEQCEGKLYRLYALLEKAKRDYADPPLT